MNGNMGGERNPHKLDVKPGMFIVGMILLILGVLLLIDRAGVMDLGLNRIAGFLILAVGGFEAIKGFATVQRRRLFWGSALFLSGILVGLISYGFIPEEWEQIWPSAFLILGLSFLMLYFASPKEYSLAFVAASIVAVGVAGLLFVRGYLDMSESMSDVFRFLLPAIIVLTGFYVIWNNFIKRRL
jgi:hypothetical protein